MNNFFKRERQEGTGLALSGGGFRATLFHIGSLIRLNELGYLKKLNEITSVSGGSIIGAYLGYRWNALKFNGEGVATNFNETVVIPLRNLCSNTIDVGSISLGILSPIHHPSDILESKYKKYLFGNATLSDLPSDDEGPRFTIYATSMQTGVSVRFARPYMAEYRIGYINNLSKITLAKAVAASSGFPPVLCPVKLEIDPEYWLPWRTEDSSKDSDLYSNTKLKSKMFLADGGVYDNLGLERIWDRYSTVLVSDAGSPFDIIEDSLKIRFSQLFRTIRVLSIISEQTRALRKRILLDFFVRKEMTGTYWGIATKIGNYELEKNGLGDTLLQDNDSTASISNIRTRLNKFGSSEQEQIINWGYALTDAAMRRHVLLNGTEQGSLPFLNNNV